MPIRVAGPDGRTYDFPDGTPPAVMERVLAKQYAKKPGPLQGLKDLGAQFVAGGVGSTRAVTDVFGASNAASDWLRAREEEVQGGLSSDAKRKQEASAAILAASKDGTILQQIAGAARAFGANPLGNIAQGAGSIALPVAAGVGTVLAAPPAAAAAAATATGVGIGALMGAGSVKGSVYDAVYGAMTERGASPARAEAAAKRAQSYGGDNLDQILLAAGIGGVTGLAGAEGAAIRSAIMKRLGGRGAAEAAAAQAVSALPAKGVVRRTVETGLAESATEGGQSGQEQLAENLALRRAGFDTPLMRGVAGAATQDAIVGGILGGAFGATERTRPGAEPSPGDTTAPPPPAGGAFSPETFGLAPGVAQGYRAPTAEEQVDVARVDPRRRGPSVPVVDDGRGALEPTGATPAVSAGGLGGVGAPAAVSPAAEELVQPTLAPTVVAPRKRARKKPEPPPAQELAAQAADQAATLGIPQEERPAFVAGALTQAYGEELSAVDLTPEQVPVAEAGAEWAAEQAAAAETVTQMPRTRRVRGKKATPAEITPPISAPAAEIMASNPEPTPQLPELPAAVAEPLALEPIAAPKLDLPPVARVKARRAVETFAADNNRTLAPAKVKEVTKALVADPAADLSTLISAMPSPAPLEDSIKAQWLTEVPARLREQFTSQPEEFDRAIEQWKSNTAPDSTTIFAGREYTFPEYLKVREDIMMASMNAFLGSEDTVAAPTPPRALKTLQTEAQRAESRKRIADKLAALRTKRETEAPAPEPKFTPADVAQAKETFAPTTEVPAPAPEAPAPAPAPEVPAPAPEVPAPAPEVPAPAPEVPAPAPEGLEKAQWLAEVPDAVRETYEKNPERFDADIARWKSLVTPGSKSLFAGTNISFPDYIKDRERKKAAPVGAFREEEDTAAASTLEAKKAEDRKNLAAKLMALRAKEKQEAASAPAPAPAPAPSGKKEQVQEEVLHAALKPKEQQTLAKVYGQPEYNDVAKAKFVEDFIAVVNGTAKNVLGAVRVIIKRVSAAVLAVALVFNPASLSNAKRIAGENFVQMSPAQAGVGNGRVAQMQATLPADMSQLAQLVYSNVVTQATKNGKGFFIADKPNGMLYAFDGNGKLVASGPALFGKAAGDVLKGDSLDATATEADRITPAGRFTGRMIDAPDYAGGKALMLYTPDGRLTSTNQKQGIAIHAVFIGNAAERRAERLLSGTAEDNKVSFGCINTGNEMFLNSILPAAKQFDGGAVFVLPDNTAATESMFPATEFKHILPPPLVGVEGAEQVVREATKVPSLSRKVDKLVQLYEDELISGDELADAVSYHARAIERARWDKQTRRSTTPRVRGADYIRQRLLEAKRRGDISEEAADLAEWFIQRNPALVDDLGISVREGTDSVTAGSYNPLSRVMTLIKSAGRDETIVHEVLHHLERMLPGDIQASVRTSWLRALTREEQAGRATQNPNQIEFFKAARAGNTAKASELVADGKVGYRFYQYVNPSEFWAVNASRIVQGEFDVRGSTLGKLRKWLSDFAARIRHTLGLPSDYLLLRALRSLAASDGRFVSDHMLAGAGARDYRMYIGAEAAERFGEGSIPADTKGFRPLLQMSYQENLDIAKDMEEQGKDATTIRNATGWFRNTHDGKWRFEINDSDATFNTGWENIPEDVGVRLGYVFSHPQLFALYPELADVTFVKEDLGPNGRGAFDETENVISVAKNAEDPVSVLLHEVMHWVQGQEGFARGANVDDVLSLLNDTQKDGLVRQVKQKKYKTLLKHTQVVQAIDYALQNKLWQEWRAAQDNFNRIKDTASNEERWAALDHTRELEKKAKKEVFTARGLQTDGEGREAYSAVFSTAPVDTSLGAKGYREIVLRNKDRVRQQLNQLNSLPLSEAAALAMELSGDKYNIYKAVAGEIEARDVQARFTDAAKYDFGYADPLTSEAYPKGTAIVHYNSGPVGSIAAPMGVRPPPPGMPPVPPTPAHRRARRAAGRVGAYLERKLSDKYRGVKDYDAAVPAGESLTESVGKLASRRAGAQGQLERQFFDPIMRMVRDDSLDPQDVGMYLWARGAWDRNAKIGVDTLGQVTDGSGLTDAEAAQVFNDFAQRGLLQKLERVALKHDRLVDHMNALRVDAGLITAAEAAQQRAAQPYYTPMKGHASAGDMQIEGDVDPHEEFRSRGKQRVAASEYMKARGRETMPFNPLFSLFQDAAHVADRAEINRASLPLLNNIKADVVAHDGLIEVNPRTGLGYFTDTHPDLQSNGMPVSMRGNKDYWHVRDNGEPHYIKFAKTPEGVELRRVFENITPKEMGGFMKAWSAIARVQRQTMTTWNPMFHLVAIGRDISDAVSTAYAKQDARSSPAFGTRLGSLTAKYASSPTVMAATMSYVNGSTPATAQQATLHALIDQLITDGGTVGHSLIKDAETYAADAIADLQRYTKAKKGDPVALASTGVRAVGKVMDSLAKVGDIHARLATYMAALQSGLSRADAATLALDSSLNLTKRGEWAPVLDNLFYFFSPTVEGARKFARTAASGKGAVKVLGSFAALGAMATLWNGLVMGGDDDDDGRPNFMGVNQTLRQTRLILFYGHGADDYVAIPVGFLGALPMYAGGRITEGFMGVASDEQVGASVASTLLDMSKAASAAMSPLRPQGGDLTEATASLTPTLVKPFADLAVNRNYFGSPIYNEQPYSTALKSEQSRESTGAGWKWLASTMNTLSGGDSTLPGFIDWQPEGYRYAFEAMAGGPYRLGKDVYKAVSGTSDDTGLAAVPFIRNFVGKGSKYAPMNAYYKATDDMKRILAAEDDASDAEWAALRAKYPLETDVDVLDAYDETSTELRALNRDMRDELDGVTDPQERKAVMDAYQLLKTDEYQRFNQIYQAKRKAIGE